MRKRAERLENCKLYVTLDGLASMLDVGRSTAKRIGEEAGARVKYGACVRYSVAKVEEYMNALTEKGA